MIGQLGYTRRKFLSSVQTTVHLIQKFKPPFPVIFHNLPLRLSQWSGVPAPAIFDKLRMVNRMAEITEYYAVRVCWMVRQTTEITECCAVSVGWMVHQMTEITECYAVRMCWTVTKPCQLPYL